MPLDIAEYYNCCQNKPSNILKDYINVISNVTPNDENIFDSATIVDITNLLIKISDKNISKEKILNSVIKDNINQIPNHIKYIKDYACSCSDFSEILNNVIEYNKTLFSTLEYYSDRNQNDIYYGNFKKIFRKYIPKVELVIKTVNKFPNCKAPYQEQLNKLQEQINTLQEKLKVLDKELNKYCIKK